MERNQASIWLTCSFGFEQETEDKLRAAFASAGIADQLVDVIALPGPDLSAGEGILRRARAMQSFSQMLVKVLRTDESAAVLRGGWKAGTWQIARSARKNEPQNAAPQEYPFKHRERVRVTAWPLEGLRGKVLWMEKGKAQVLVNIEDFGERANVFLYPDELVKEIGDKPEPPDVEKSQQAWYVLYSTPGTERMVRDNLRKRLNQAGLLHRLYDIVIPGEGQENIALVKDGKVQIISPTLFPGRIFVLMSLDEGAWNVVRQTPGMTGFVGQGNTPRGYPAASSGANTRPAESAASSGANTRPAESAASSGANTSEASVSIETEASIEAAASKPAESAASSGDEASETTDAAHVTSPLQPGDRVRIRSGPYQNFRGVVIEVDAERSRLRVMVDFFGRPTETELDAAQVEKE